MAVALQWHVAFNTEEPVAIATSRSAETGIGEKDVLLVVADCTQGQAHDARTAAALAHHIFDAYQTRESKSITNGAGDMDAALWLAEAVGSGLKRISQGELEMIGSAGQPASTASHNLKASVVATVIHHNHLLVARYGGGRVYLLRDGALQNLTDDAFTSPHTDTYEPDLGQLDLTGEDRILLCTDAFHDRLNDLQVKSVLRSTPSSRRAAQTLLDAATRVESNDTIALAVADYVTGKTGIFPVAPSQKSSSGPVQGPRRGTYRSIAAIAALLLLIGAALIAIALLRGDGGATRTRTNTAILTATPGAEATLRAIVPLTPTTTIEPTETVAPTATPIATTSATPSATPEPVATDTPEPTATAEPSPTPTRRPTRRPTQTAVPTATPIPPTPTPELPTPTPTITPVPPWELNKERPPCPPGATCP
jgi:serine/threonine protein phosphatase PrpC